MKITKYSFMLGIAVLALCISITAYAAITQDEVNLLGTKLTPVGAQKEGNSEGTIPPYSGGLHKSIPGTKGICDNPKGCGLRPDPYAGETPLFSITSENMDQYAGKLSEGTKAMVKKYSKTLRLDIYKTHRSAAFPQWVLDNTKKVALTAQTKSNGLLLVNAHAGIPFPIPKTGYEVMWNQITRFEGILSAFEYKGIVIDRTGRPTLGQECLGFDYYPYWETDSKSDIYFYHKNYKRGPARIAGQTLLLQDPLDQYNRGRSVWQYLVGQRRVKLTPEIAFDTPDPGTGGVSTCDDAWMFNGSMERFDFKLIGKKEMYVPYNDFKLSYHVNSSELFRRGHMNPDDVRWELHRVWVVESTLKPGKRHTYSKRVYYIDEDSWHCLVKDEYDPRGQIYRVGYAYMAPSYEMPCPQSLAQAHFDLISGQYTINGWAGIEDKTGIYYPKLPPARFWTADDLVGGGVR